MITADAFRAWQESVGLTNIQAADVLGRGRNAIQVWRRDGVPDREAILVGLAMRAVTAGLHQQDTAPPDLPPDDGIRRTVVILRREIHAIRTVERLLKAAPQDKSFLGHRPTPEQTVLVSALQGAIRACLITLAINALFIPAGAYEDNGDGYDVDATCAAIRQAAVHIGQIDALAGALDDVERTLATAGGEAGAAGFLSGWAGAWLSPWIRLTPDGQTAREQILSVNE